MPTYEYVCNACNYHFEEFQSITAPPLTECPECRGAVRRLISPGNGLIFKGSGFYITDYKNSGGDSEKKPESSKGESKESSSTLEKKSPDSAKD